MRHIELAKNQHAQGLFFEIWQMLIDSKLLYHLRSVLWRYQFLFSK